MDRWLGDLRDTLAAAARLVDRGRDAFDEDAALPLAFEALSNRIGELAKRLLHADQDRFTDPVWRQAARSRDFVVHHYDRLDGDLLWRTVTTAFPVLAALVQAEIGTTAGREATPGHDGP
ncbi:HepT-like ribonuclease domain-containing protein [Microbacterium sp. EST19A]|uniref:HepT-like ribonuclease domain-containing protein n=1 Tax=Microbacterium sp. EST19A TaxID=2862681 RepID=UPI001CBC3DFE|nr:HepT-like ribonuclease domain-containing protein [Microbacterium sp. EST19A]